MSTRYAELVATRDAAQRDAKAARDAAIADLNLQVADERETCAQAIKDAEAEFQRLLEFYRANLAADCDKHIGAVLEQYADSFYRDTGRKLMALVRGAQESCVAEADSYLDPRWLVAAFATRVAKRFGPISGHALEAAHRIIKAASFDDIAALEVSWRELESAVNGHPAGNADDQARMQVALSCCDYAGLAERLAKHDAQVKARIEAEHAAEYERVRHAREHRLPEPAPALSTLDLIKKFAPDLASALNV